MGETRGRDIWIDQLADRFGNSRSLEQYLGKQIALPARETTGLPWPTVILLSQLARLLIVSFPDKETVGDAPTDGHQQDSQKCENERRFGR